MTCGFFVLGGFLVCFWFCSIHWVVGDTIYYDEGDSKTIFIHIHYYTVLCWFMRHVGNLPLHEMM